MGILSNKQFVSWHNQEGLGIMKINNPPVNALNKQVINETIHCLSEMEQDFEVRVVIVTGAGEKAFVAGADIKELPGLLQGEKGTVVGFATKGHEMFNKLDYFSKPTIAAVNGLCLGGGCEIAIACDLRVSSDKAQFGLPEINLGIFPGGGGTQRLPRLIGESKAKELMYLGNYVSAQEALNMGLVNKVVKDGEFWDLTIKLAKAIAKKPGMALNSIKQCVKMGMETSLKDGLNIEADLFDKIFLTEDAKEGINSFLEKRKPVFKHC